ncbi:ANTAR domain-containing response regulator [Brevibacillus marinus]|uniref:ANTAR domain-containing response regulator n=1 Tax=Brevibacillus marinus TaxID=2496837 RepID=UPI000F848615|nr:response regulator [Brevibacillus marinus]
MNRPTIVVVDDEPIIRMDIREILEHEYRVVAEGKNGEEAVALAHKHKPDLMIMDVKMPVLNGIKATTIIRKFSDCSVLLLTAYSHKELVQEARQAGVTAYLVKPVTEEDLIPAVEIALNQRDQLTSLKRDIENMKRKIEERKVIERAKGKLMDQFSLSEPEAYRWIRQESMNRRISMIQLAEELLFRKEIDVRAD